MTAELAQLIAQVSDCETQHQAALHLAHNGIPVFPVDALKAPKTRNGFRDATADIAVIHEWWARGDWGIALVPGSVDLFVVDVDSEDARDKFGELRGDAKPLMITSTPQGGVRQHIWFKSPEVQLSKGESVGKVKGLDFRHHNGYVVVRNDHDPNGNYKHYVQPESEGSPPAAFIEFIIERNKRAESVEIVKTNGTPQFTDSSPGHLETVSSQASKMMLKLCQGDMNALYKHVIHEDIRNQLTKVGSGTDPYGDFVSFRYERSANKSPEGLKIYPNTLKAWVHSGTLQTDLGVWNEGPWGMMDLFIIRTCVVQDAMKLLQELKQWISKNYQWSAIIYDERTGARLYEALTEIYGIQMYLNKRSSRMEFENFPTRQLPDGTWLRDPGVTCETSRLHDVLLDFINSNSMFVRMGRAGLFEPKHLGEATYKQLMNSMAYQNQIDRFHEWLNELPPWDRTPRIPTLLSDLFQMDSVKSYAELQDFAMYSVLGGAIRRTLYPGCKHDTVMVLTSPQQGIGKSTFFRKLFPPEFENQWFNDSVHLTDLADPKLTIERVGEAVLVEISDNSGRGRSDLRSLKGGITRQTDTTRLAYGRTTEIIERRWICVLTSNETDTVLQPDPSGQRRWIPINVVGVQPANMSPAERMEYLNDFLNENREQIWAEALHRVKRNEPTYPHTKELIKAIASVSEIASEEDEIITSIRHALNLDNLPANMRLTVGEIAVLAGLGGPDTFTGGTLRALQDFLADNMLAKEDEPKATVQPLLRNQGHIVQKDRMLVLRVERALKTLGWEKAKNPLRRPGDDVRTRFWLAPDDWWEPF